MLDNYASLMYDRRQNRENVSLFWNFTIDYFLAMHRRIVMDLKRERLKRGMSLSQLSEKSGVPVLYLKELEKFDYKGYSQNNENANKAAAALGLLTNNDEYKLRLELKDKYYGAESKTPEDQQKKIIIYRFDNNSGNGYNFSLKKPLGMMSKKLNTIAEEYILPNDFTALYDRSGTCVGVKTGKGEILGDCVKTGKVPAFLCNNGKTFVTLKKA